VYIRLDEDCYEKSPVARGGSDGQRVEILSGITPGEHVVTDGMAYVRLAENVGAVPGHSHTH
ncbi:MAG: efflux transporter periplasmic adaptor subunit, partial [Muribaculaceae bacterium]|nr:efflux transporter periplasmic adaptor subunit [Muribaculaceae bacterium]